MSVTQGSLTLVNLQSPINVGMLLRVGDMYGRRVLIADAHKAFDSRTFRETVSDFAVGALQRLDIHWIDADDLRSLSAVTGGRSLGTDSSPDAINVFDFKWRASDNILLGNEYDGFGEAQLKLDAVLRIPMPEGHFPKPKSFVPIDPQRKQRVSNDGMPSLNVAMAGTTLCAVAYNALLGHDLPHHDLSGNAVSGAGTPTA